MPYQKKLIKIENTKMKHNKLVKFAIVASMALSVMDALEATLAKSVDHPLYKLIPQGCFGQKQLHTLPQFRKFYKHKPITPEWCSENDFLATKRMKIQKFQTTAPPYHIHVDEFQQSKNVFRVLLKSELSSPINEAILVARPINSNGIVIPTNIGKFLHSPGVNPICCSRTDMDVATFESKGTFVDEVVFYWTPYEEVTEDFEGHFIFMATVAKDRNKYWINVTSKSVNVPSTALKMFNVK